MSNWRLLTALRSPPPLPPQNQGAFGAEADDDGPKLLLAGGFNMETLASFAPIQEAEVPSQPTSEPVIDSKKKSKLGTAINWGRSGSRAENSA